MTMTEATVKKMKMTNLAEELGTEYLSDIYKVLSNILNKRKSFFAYGRISNRGVPHMVIKDKVSNVKYSLCYFATTNKWTLFTNYLSKDKNKEQEKIKFDTARDALNYLIDLRNSSVKEN